MSEREESSSMACLPLRTREGHLHAVIEASAGSRNKFKFDPRLGAFVLHSVLPLGTSFPYDFGFLPSTCGEDGDPLDVLVFVDEAAPVGSVVPCRLLGIIEAEQSREGEERVRNDRLLAVACGSQRYGEWQAMADVPGRVLDQLESFFRYYNAQKGKRFEPLARHGRRQAEAAIATGERAAKPRR